MQTSPHKAHLGQRAQSAFRLSSRPRRNQSISGLNIKGEHEKTALSDGSIGFVPFGNNWYFCLTQGVNLTFGQGTRSGYLPAESGSGSWARTSDLIVNSDPLYH